MKKNSLYTSVKEYILYDLICNEVHRILLILRIHMYTMIKTET